MATLVNLLRGAIYSKAMADSTLKAVIDDRFYFIHASSGAIKPYVLFSAGATSPRLVMNISAPPATNISLYFDIYSSTITSTESETIQKDIHDIFDSASISITGYAGMDMRRGPEIPIYEEDSGLWHINITYYAIATKN